MTKRVTCNRPYSVDGGHTWIPVQSTGTATTTVAGLAPLSTPSFRVGTVIGGVVQPCSQVVTILVH